MVNDIHSLCMFEVTSVQLLALGYIMLCMLALFSYINFIVVILLDVLKLGRVHLQGEDPPPLFPIHSSSPYLQS